MRFCVASLPDGLGECLAGAGYELRGDAGTLGTSKKLECNHLTVAAHDCDRFCVWVIVTWLIVLGRSVYGPSVGYAFLDVTWI